MRRNSLVNLAVETIACPPAGIAPARPKSTACPDAALELRGVSKSYGSGAGRTVVLENVDLRIGRGEFVAIVGFSGSGKTTLVSLLAGLSRPDRGEVLMNGQPVSGPGPDRGVVFQNHSLLPWLSCYENVELAVRQVFKGQKSKREMRDWIEHNLDLVHMTHARDKRPSEISGGMKQRIGIARALAMQPKVLLMDEPFGALDALTRAHLQDSLMEIHADLGNTVIMITHDVDEAVLLSDRIVMMTNGPSATIGEILRVELKYPRDRMSLAHDAQYHAYRAQVLEFLYQRQQRPAA